MECGHTINHERIRELEGIAFEIVNSGLNNCNRYNVRSVLLTTTNITINFIDYIIFICRSPGTSSHREAVGINYKPKDKEFRNNVLSNVSSLNQAKIQICHRMPD